MRINCHIPVTVRIVGVPTDDQLAAVGDAVARAVAARMAEAERLLADRHRVRQYLPAESAAGPVAEVGGVLDETPSSQQEAVFTLAAFPAGDAVAQAVHGTPARIDQAGVRRYEEQAAVARHGGDPNVPVPRQPDPLGDAARDAAAHPPVTHYEMPDDAVLPGDTDQQDETITDVDPEDLWRLPHIQDIFTNLEQYMATAERNRHRTGPSTDPANWLEYWHTRFVRSVLYILDVRPTHRHLDAKTKRSATYPARIAHLLQLRDAEADVLATRPAAGQSAEGMAMWAMGAVLRVRELRRTAQAEWLAEVARAADQYVVIAQNEARFLGEDQHARPVAVYGLPEALEGTVPASAFPALFEPGGPGFSPAVARFMAALQQASGLHVLAGNYADHEKGNPYVGDVESIGKYSFDLSPDIPLDGNGFYEHDAVVRFLLAMERASAATRIAWVALYNDRSVAREVNERIGRRRIGFSGGGGQGSFHHGPAPYILHIHVNIMPTDLAAQVFVGDSAPPDLDLGDQP